MFELASFLRSRPREATISQHLSIRPNLVGPVLLIGKAGLIVLLVAWPSLQAYGTSIMVMALWISAGLLPCFLCLAHIGRRFCYNLDTLQQQLRKFQVDDAKCYCCTLNHLDDEAGEATVTSCCNALESGLEAPLTSSAWCGDLSGQRCFESSPALFICTGKSSWPAVP